MLLRTTQTSADPAVLPVEVTTGEPEVYPKISGLVPADARMGVSVPSTVSLDARRNPLFSTV